MLKWIVHDETGETLLSPKLGQHNRETYGDWLGLSAAEIAALEQDRVI
jgi:crotonobetainyl-CoA:carnitine CoA-transferase CaiB-like acyl-CoA transferase